MSDIHWWLEYRRTMAFGVPSAVLLLIGSFATDSIPIAPVVFQALGSALISTLVIRTLFEFVGRQDIASTFRIIQAQSETGIDDVAFPVQKTSWRPWFQSSRKVTIVGMRLNFVENPEYFMDIRKILSGGGKVTIILADPRSDAMRLRYLEEPHPSPYGTDPFGWSNGLEQLCSFAGMLHDRKLQLKNTGVDVRNLKFAVFPHYLTLAIYRFDSTIYAYAYPYKRRGFNGPLFSFRAESPAGKFLSECLDEMVKDSIDIEHVIDDIRNKCNAGLLSDATVLARKSAMTSRE